MKKFLLSILLAATLSVELVHAAGGVVKSPTGTAPDRYVYYPGTEKLAKDGNSTDRLRYRDAGGTPWTGSNLLPVRVG